MRLNANLPDGLDLTSERVRRALKIKKADITQVPDPLIIDSIGRPPEYELPQMIGDLAYELEIPTIIYPSARTGIGANVVVFIDYLEMHGGWIETVNPVTGEKERIP